MSLTRSRIRQLSAVMLVVWLFVLAAGVAHACAARTASQHASTAEHCEHHAMAHDQDHPVSDGARAACEKLCADAPAPSPKSQAAQTDMPSIQAVDAALPIQHWRFDPSVQSRDTPLRDTDADPPAKRNSLAIVFLRLTL